MYLKSNLKLLRKKQSLSYRQLGECTKVNFSRIRKLENEDSSNPKISTLKKLADYFSITIDELVYKDLSKNVPVTGTSDKGETL